MISKYLFDTLTYINRTENKYNFIIISFLVLCAGFIAILFFNIEIFYNTSGYIVLEDDKRLLKLSVYENDINKVVNGNEMIIGDYKYDYSIYKVSYETFIDSVELKNYKEIFIDSNFEDSEVNEILKVKFFVKKEKIYKYLYNYLLGDG